MSNTIAGPDGKLRCGWCAAAPEFLHYHDTEWGFPVSDDRRLFEKLSLEGFQSGLSWRTILAKRDNFRAAFHHFDFERLARFGALDVERLLKNEGIVRHRGKIEAVINNARRARELVQREGSLATFVWRHEPAAEDARRSADGIDLGDVDRAVQGAEEAGLAVRGADDRLCIHAGDGAGQRPRSGVRRPRRGRARAQALRAAARLTRRAPRVALVKQRLRGADRRRRG